MLKSLIDLGRFFSSHPLSRDAPLKAWLRFFSWQARRRFQQEVVFKWIAGRKLAVRSGMTGATGNIYVGLHEFPDMMFVLHFLREGDLFLDIGANVGSYTVLASGVRRATTWAFEPDPNALQWLKRNVAINELCGVVTVFECALGADEAETPFTIGRDTQNRVASPGDENVRLVRQERLDALIGPLQPLMIKMDVERYEQQVLIGAGALLARPCLKAIELETVTQETISLMLRYDFHRAYYDAFSRTLSSEPIGDRASNALYIRDWPFVQERLATAEKIEILGRSI